MDNLLLLQFMIFKNKIWLTNKTLYIGYNVATTSGGLPTGALYRTSTGDLKVKY